MSNPTLEWYQSHPYVQQWRQTNCNSFFPTVKSLNETLNINIDHPITLARVSNVVGEYLNLLATKIRKTCNEEKLPRSRHTVAERFELNRTEIEIIINKLNPIKV